MFALFEAWCMQTFQEHKAALWLLPFPKSFPLSSTEINYWANKLSHCVDVANLQLNSMDLFLIKAVLFFCGHLTELCLW